MKADDVSKLASFAYHSHTGMQSLHEVHLQPHGGGNYGRGGYKKDGQALIAHLYIFVLEVFNSIFAHQNSGGRS